MLTYNMDVEERSVWLRATPNNAVLAQPFYATEVMTMNHAHSSVRTQRSAYRA